MTVDAMLTQELVNNSLPIIHLGEQVILLKILKIVFLKTAMMFRILSYSISYDTLSSENRDAPYTETLE